MKLLHGDCLEQMRTLADNSVDAIVSDPPYGIKFMSKRWDYSIPSVDVWEEAMRVLKPGGHALIACGTRTQHRMVVNIEDAGFEIRDVVSWIYGSGFPKSLNVSKAIDKAAGAEREVVGVRNQRFGLTQETGWNKTSTPRNTTIKDTATEAAKQWDGWGTALKPACEFFTLCRKPLSEKTIAKNVLKWGTGGINIDGCRVGIGTKVSGGGNNYDMWRLGENREDRPRKHKEASGGHEKGRFPANLIHDGAQEVLELFPETKPSKSGGVTSRTGNGAEYGMGTAPRTGHNDQGSAARFFYCPKASKKDRNEGCDELEKGNNHATVKPTALMAYLCRLITPVGGTVLDPYMGSGSTGKAAVSEGFDFIGIEINDDYFEIAKKRI